MQTWRKADLKRGFCLSCLGFVGWSYICGSGFPRSCPERRQLVPFGGLSQYPYGPQGLVQRGDTWSQFPLLRWDEDDRWETVSNTEVCRNVQTISNKLHENVWAQGHKGWKITCDMVVQFGYVGFMVNGSLLRRCHCPMMIKDGATETLSHRQSISEGTHDPWKDRVFCAQVPNLVVVWSLVGTCLDVNWMSLDLSCFKR